MPITLGIDLGITKCAAVLYETEEKKLLDYRSVPHLADLPAEEGGSEQSPEKILNAIRKDHLITRQELMKVTGLSRNGVEWQIKKLRAAGKLDRVGTTRKGFWVILEAPGKK